MCIAVTATTSRSSNLKELKKTRARLHYFCGPSLSDPSSSFHTKSFAQTFERSLAAAGSEYTALSLSPFFLLLFMFFSKESSWNIFSPTCLLACARVQMWNACSVPRLWLREVTFLPSWTTLNTSSLSLLMLYRDIETLTKERMQKQFFVAEYFWKKRTETFVCS